MYEVHTLRDFSKDLDENVRSVATYRLWKRNSVSRKQARQTVIFRDKRHLVDRL